LKKQNTFLALCLVVGLLISSVIGGTTFSQAQSIEIDPLLTDLLEVSSSDTVHTAIITYDHYPTSSDLLELETLGLDTYLFNNLPMIAIEGTSLEIEATFLLSGIRSIYADKELEYFLDESVSYIEADRVWNDSKLGYLGEGVTVAVIDSGIDATHPDLLLGEKTIQNVKLLVGNNIFGGESTYLEDVPNTDTSSGHGTHVAGTIAGTGAASDGLYAGVAPGANLVGLGTGEGLSILWALAGFDYVMENQEKYNIQVISNSWGTEGAYSPNNPINVASKEAHDAGMVVAFASGNSGPEQNTLNPYSVAPWVIGVAAGTKDDGQLADFSSRGVEGDDLLHPTITAPGVDIVAAKSSTGVVMNTLGTRKDATTIAPEHQPYYTTASGTSMATPHISGVVALMLSANPGTHPDIIKKVLEDTATPMPDYQEFEVGAGYVQAYDAVTKILRTGKQLGKYKDPETGKEYDTITETFTWDGTVTPGVALADAASYDYYSFEINEDTVNLTVRIDWTNVATDLDLYVYAPDGSLAGSSAQGVTTFEETNIAGPVSGNWTAEVEGWLSVVEAYEGTYTVEYILK
jgi:serine protease AprX